MKTVLIILVAAALLYALAAGLGLTHSRKKGLAKKTTMISDFEDANNDFDWSTGGYAKMEQSTQNATHSKHSAKLTFYTQDAFVATPTPGVTWQPMVTLDTRSVTKLTVFDWSEYTSLKLDAFNPQDNPVTYHLKVMDSKSYTYETSGPLLPKKVTNIALMTDDLDKARIDLTMISGLQFWVDMAGATAPATVYIDNLRLEFDPGDVKKK